MVEIIALNSQDTQKFAENVCFDYNPIHKAANNPQYLPGDWLFLKYLEHQGLPKAQTLTFKGNGGVSPEEIIEVKENEIVAKNTQVKFQEIDSIKTLDGYFLDHAICLKDANNTLALKQFFPSFDHKTLEFTKQYCMISGDLVGCENLSGGVLEKILNKENLQKTKDSLFIYRGSSFIINPRLDEIKPEENLTRDLIHVETSMNRGIFKIAVRYILFNKETRYRVADLRKEVVCYNLQPK